jgi:radical SAM protein with 4Fe4S-binding SPASM domain
MMADSGNSDMKPAFLAYTQTIRPVIFWNLTRRCNLSCEHCYNSSGASTGISGELTTAEAISFLDDCKTLAVPVILLSGGEPLMREDIWELAEHASRLGIRTALSTNGTLITSAVAEKINKAGIGYAGISLDGAAAATHNRFRNCDGAFERAIGAFSACQAAGVRCGVRVTVHKENITELGDIIDLALRIGASRFCVYWLVPSGRGAESYARLQLSQDEVFWVLQTLHRYARDIDPSRMEFLTVDGPQDAVHLLRLMEEEGSLEQDDARTLIASMKGGCSAGIRVANVSETGAVYPCQFAQTPEFCAGSVRQRKFSELWNDPENPVLSRFRMKRSELKGRCSTCRHLDLCGGGCRIRAYMATGDFSADDPFCFIQP